MEYSKLLDMATDLGYELAMSGAETFRVEESINRVLSAYGIEAEVFAIPNYLIVSIVTDDGTPMTRMRRIGAHDNDLDAVEKFNGLSRAFCNRKPDPDSGQQWLQIVRERVSSYSRPMELMGDFLGASGFTLLFGGSVLDSLCGGICGIAVGLISRFLSKQKSNPFFRTNAASFIMAMLAYSMNLAGICQNADAVIIGALMLLVPGLLFTNAMRDIIYGDTNSGINRIVQVALTAIAIALGTAVAWSAVSRLLGTPSSAEAIVYSIPAHCIFAFVGCVGFSILFNIHGKGMLLCALGGMLCWAIYLAILRSGSSDIMAYFWSALVASIYSEVLARIRKCPAIAYLVVAIFTMIPGAGAYYTMHYAVQGKMDLFATTGVHTAAIAGTLAVGILLGSTVFKMIANRK